MEDTEEYFPRGGKKPTLRMKQTSNFLGAIVKGDKKKKKQKKKSENDDGYLSDDGLSKAIANCAAGICYKATKPGLLILGRIRAVHETKLNVLLPSRMMGTVMACHVSEPYNKLLEAYIDDKIEHVRELPVMFKPGQYVALKVLEVKEDHLMLSMMPQHVNGNLTLADLHNGALLQAAVSSVEDHGFVMDIGIPDARAFLPKANVNPDVELDTGMLTWCVVKKVSNDVVTLSSKTEALQAGTHRHGTITNLLPGTAVYFSIDKPLDNGIEGRILDDITAYIQRQHAASIKGKKPAIGQKIRARVLYVMPIKNTPFLTMKDAFGDTNLKDEMKFNEGDVVEDAQVLKITGRSIHFRLAEDAIGTMSLKRVTLHEDLSDEEILSKSYPIGSTHKVRILLYHLSDYTYSVSDEPSVLNEKYFNMQQLSPGDQVQATVESVAESYILLTVGRFIGVVPHAHLSDAGIVIDSKKPNTSKLSKKFKVGQKVRARVLSVDPEQNKLVLTLKSTLLDPKLDVLRSYEQADVGKAYTGVIKFIRDYILVTFFNNVIAFVPRNLVTKNPDEDLTAAFHVGQIVNCTILNVDVENKKMCGSLTTAPFWPAKKREKAEKRKYISENGEETISKKSKIEDEKTDIKNKKKHEKNKQEIGNRNMVKKKENKKSLDESGNTEINKIELGKKEKKKKNKIQSNNGDTEETTEVTDQLAIKVDKKRKKTDESALNTDEAVEIVQKKKKNKKAIEDTNEEASNSEKNHAVETDKNIKRNETKKIAVKEISIEETKVSEESDVIETIINEDSDHILTAQDLGLIDMSDFTTVKQYKRRYISLLKSINARQRRIETIDKKIAKIEANGLNAKNKKYHTAMHTEKLIVEERINKLIEAAKFAQDKLKEIGQGCKKEIKLKKEDKNNKDKKGKNKDVNDRKRKISESETEVSVKEKLLKDIKVVESLEPELEVPSAKEFWTTNPEDFSKKVQEEESSSSDEEQENQPKKKRKKLTAAEKAAKVRAEEERVREAERRATESDAQPRSVEQFERALLASPSCSQLWLAYMAFHLQATEIDKARAVARKALNTISFREEDEKLNIWLAMLNFENRFGTKESQQKTLEEALQMNDTFKVHSKLLDIYVDTSKQQELSSLVDLMLRKYKRDPSMYTMCGSACFKLGLVDKARQVMQKAISVLEKKEHVSVLVQFSLLERSHGARERSEALLEQVLAVYPQRTDVAAVYVDMLIKDDDIKRVRQLMERMTSLNMPARKMKFLYKKWTEAEEKLGDQEQINSIRQRALEYIEKAKF